MPYTIKDAEDAYNHVMSIAPDDTLSLEDFAGAASYLAFKVLRNFENLYGGLTDSKYGKELIFKSVEEKVILLLSEQPSGMGESEVARVKWLAKQDAEDIGNQYFDERFREYGF